MSNGNAAIQYDEIVSMLRDISRRCGVAATGEWMRGEIDRVANKLEVWSGNSKPPSAPQAGPTLVQVLEVVASCWREGRWTNGIEVQEKLTALYAPASVPAGEPTKEQIERALASFPTTLEQVATAEAEMERDGDIELPPRLRDPQAVLDRITSKAAPLPSAGEPASELERLRELLAREQDYSKSLLLGKQIQQETIASLTADRDRLKDEAVAKDLRITALEDSIAGCARRLAAAVQLLREVNEQAGNEAETNRRHALTPKVRDAMRDFLAAPPSPAGEGSTREEGA